MNKEKAFQIFYELLSKSSLDPQLREAINTLMDEVVVNKKKAELFEKALEEAEDMIAALQLDLGIRSGRHPDYLEGSPFPSPWTWNPSDRVVEAINEVTKRIRKEKGVVSEDVAVGVKGVGGTGGTM